MGRPIPWIASAALAGLAAFGAACDLERCTIQSRSIELEAAPAAPLAGVFGLELAETRGSENAPWILWHVRVTPLPATAARVSLREGPPDAPGRLLYELPLVNAVPPSGVVTQTFGRTPYAGAVPFPELWDLVQRAPVSFEVVFADGAAPLRVGPLRQTRFTDWQDTCS